MHLTGQAGGAGAVQMARICSGVMGAGVALLALFQRFDPDAGHLLPKAAAVSWVV